MFIVSLSATNEANSSTEVEITYTRAHHHHCGSLHCN